MAGWLRVVAKPILAVGVFCLFWLLGSGILLWLGSEEGPLFEVVSRAAITGTLVIGLVATRRTRYGFLGVALAGALSVLVSIGPALDGGMSSLLACMAGAITTVAALVLLWTTHEGAKAAEPEEAAPPAAPPAPRSAVEIGLAWSVGVGGALLLGRALLELVWGLAELPGASEHWAGDVMLWLMIVLPLPILIGSAGLVAARWLARRHIGAGRAAVAWGAIASIAVLWIQRVWVTSVEVGGSFRPFDDPPLWMPYAALLGCAAGFFVLTMTLLDRSHRPGPTAHPMGH